jgi:hypothetical protein
VPKSARIAVIALGASCGVLALVLWRDEGRGDLSGPVILLGAVGLALIVIGASTTSGTRRRPARRVNRRGR